MVLRTGISNLESLVVSSVVAEKKEVVYTKLGTKNCSPLKEKSMDKLSAERKSRMACQYPRFGIWYS